MKSRKRIICSVLIAALCALLLSACVEEEEILGHITEEVLGRVTEEVGSATDYTGWWELVEHDENAPFAYVDILSAGIIRCYDKDGTTIDEGYLDYSEQRALNGNSLIVFVFGDIGKYGADPYVSGDDAYIGLCDNDGAIGELKMSDSDAFDAKFARAYSFMVHNGSDYEITSIYMGASEGSADDDEEVLASPLAVKGSVEITGTVPGRMAGITYWTLFVMGADDTESLAYHEFNLFAATNVDIHWDSERAGYYCEFSYDNEPAENGGE